MTTRNSAATRLVFAVITVAAIAFVPWTIALADAPVGGLSAKDGTEFLNHQGDGSSVQSVHSYARSAYLWPYASGPSYPAIGPSYPAIDVYEQGVLWTPAGVFQIREELTIAPELRASNKLGSFGAQYYAIAYHTELGVLDSLRTLIEGRGGIYVTSPSDGSIVAKLNASALLEVQSAVGFLAAVPYHGAFKLDSGIGRNPLPDPIKALSETYSLEISLWPGEDAAAVAQQIIAIGAEVSRTHSDSLVAEVHRNLLRQVADIDGIRAIHEDLPRLQMGEETTSVMQHWEGTWLGLTPYHDAGVTGAGLGLCKDFSTSCTFATQGPDCSGIGDGRLS